MIGVIADDLTGAAELGAVALRHGLRAEVLLLGPAGPNPSTPARKHVMPTRALWKNVDVICLDTGSRVCRPAEAARRAAAAAMALVDAKAEWIYKKTDSVLRGPVAAEIKAVMTALGNTRALLVPANPTRGRVIRNGKYYVNGKPIHRTEFAADPLHPRKTCEVRRLIEPAGVLPVHVCRPCAVLPEGGVIIGETETMRDLKIWAGTLTDGTLPAGGADFFAAVLQATGYRVCAGGKPRSFTGRQTGELFVCGTYSESARRFIGRCRQVGVPVFSLLGAARPGLRLTAKRLDATAVEAVRALRQNARVVLCTGEPLLKTHSAPKRLLKHLAGLALRVISAVPVGRIYIEGGATAAALLARLGWQRLTVVREVVPGVVTLRPVAAPERMVTIKPGSYTWPDEIISGAV